MNHIEVPRPSVNRARVKSSRAVILALLISVAKRNPKRGREALIGAFERAGLDDIECIRASLREVGLLHLTEALTLAFPLTAAEIKQRNARAAKLAKERAQEDNDAEDSLLRNVWRYTHACTFQQASRQFGTLGLAIAAVGRGRMNKRIDSVFKSPEEFEAALKGAGHV